MFAYRARCKAPEDKQTYSNKMLSTASARLLLFVVELAVEHLRTAAGGGGGEKQLGGSHTQATRHVCPLQLKN